MRWMPVLVSSALPLLFCFAAPCQEVVSAYSGTVHFFEGAVLLDDQPLEHKPATFPNIREGSTLRTEKGRAEVLLTPGVFLRIDEDSAFRMVSSSLTDTRIEFLHGSAIVDSVEASGNPPIVLTYQHCRMRFPKPGIYRIDSDTGVLQAYSGQAQAVAPDGKTSSIDPNKLYFFDLSAVTNKFGEPNEDEFYDWARGRADAISAANQLASQTNGDPDSDPALGIFTPPLPSYSTYPAYPAIGGYGFTPFFDPYFGFTGGGFAPYNTFPIFLLVPRRDFTSRWPHRNPTANPGYVASRPVLTPAPIRVPIYIPRPAPGGVGAARPYRPAMISPRPSAPIGVHAIGH
jgi:hypothetical protein